jgi:hypothetical protein
MTKTRQFDILLAYTSFRRHDYYLNIIQYLSPQYRIGILRFPPHEKWDVGEDIYLAHCEKLGCEFIWEEKVAGKALILSRFGNRPGKGYFKAILEDLPRQVLYEKLFVMTSSALEGVPRLREICQHLTKPTLLVPSCDLFGLLEPETRDFALENKIPMVEMGMPYLKYPVIKDFETDYLLAYPSHVSVQTPLQEFQLTRGLVKALKNISKSDRICVKVHNIQTEGNRLSLPLFRKNGLHQKTLVLLLVKISSWFETGIGKILFSFLPRIISSCLMRVQNDFIFNRCENLTEKYPNYGIEHFLPFVKKGVISGLSNTIVCSMVMKIPVLNVDDFPIDDRPENYKIISRLFEIEKWHSFSCHGFDKIPHSVFQSDFIEQLDSQLSQGEL